PFLRPLHADVLVNQASMELTRPEDGRWMQTPFLDCGASERYVVAFSLPFFSRAHNDDVSARLMGVVMVTFPLADVDINQCLNVDDPLRDNDFGGTDHCDQSTTQCVPIPGRGFNRGGYHCQCHPSHYIPNTTQQWFNGSDIEMVHASNTATNDMFRCLPCPEGCNECSGGSSCTVQYDTITRLVPMFVQVAAIFICFIMALAVCKLRKCKVIAASLWTMLEMLLFGATIIYCTVFLRYLEPTVLLCMLEPWFREMGFAIFYGAVILKLYRSLVDHRTRKAYRYVIKDRDLLKYLCGLAVFVIGYLAAFTALTAHLAHQGLSTFDEGITPSGMAFTQCKSLWWDYVTETGELLFVLFGLILAWHLNKAAGGEIGEAMELQERRALATALVLELCCSSVLYVARHVFWLHVHPDHVFLAYFIRTHLTISLSLLLIIMPKLWYSGGSSREVPRRTYSCSEVQEPRFCDALTNGDLEASDFNLSQMDPEEIRAELKRVYTQLEVLRTKTMRKDNPHISKRRGGRKATHRKFSLQVRNSRKGSREKSLHRQRVLANTSECTEGDITKTPEESVCSIDGPSVFGIYADGPSTYSEMGTPNILHRTYKL
ncbi:unnamed protein product, partial [Meganyctiphanes norvegica]